MNEAEHLYSKIKTIIKQGEGVRIEFKECNTTLNNEDGDFNITDNHNLVSALYLRKQIGYSENTIYPYAELADLRSDVIARVRKMALLQSENHPWGAMSDLDLLRSAQLYRKDFQTGKDGFTLAAILPFGKDETILSVVPHFRIDAILRRDNIDRYDDRDDNPH
ncbi:MAG: hypothetical protein HZB37_07595 [Planctomycetes bacterium]|nr:hypothetical protein [Planctomycetota bacterium]